MPEETPPRRKLPEKTMMTFWPRLAICCSSWERAPVPILIMAMTAPTPIMIPSMVRKVRSLLRRSAFMAMRTVARERLMGKW
jgi:hypothetical protein